MHLSRWQTRHVYGKRRPADFAGESLDLHPPPLFTLLAAHMDFSGPFDACLRAFLVSLRRLALFDGRYISNSAEVVMLVLTD